MDIVTIINFYNAAIVSCDNEEQCGTDENCVANTFQIPPGPNEKICRSK